MPGAIRPATVVEVHVAEGEFVIKRCLMVFGTTAKSSLPPEALDAENG